MKELTGLQSEQINQLWNDEYPLKLKGRFPILLDGTDCQNHYLIEDLDKNVIAWAVDFEKEKQIRFSILVSTIHKGKGLGTQLIDRLKAENQEFYGWVIDQNDAMKSNGECYQSPLAFYLKNGFEILHDLRIDNELINAVLVKWSSN